jgi:GT2 family glycosyltransferase
MSLTSDPTAAEPTPSVLAVIVVRDAIGWLRESLSALGAQTYPRLAVMGVDNGSTDGSRDLLMESLGEGRVVTLGKDAGLAGALDAVAALPPAAEADYLLVLHDDAVLDPDTVTRLVEAAVGIPGVDRVGVVGAKVVDWEDPRLLRDVGRSADLFGHPYAPLQTGEIDQGQFDRVLEVLCVSSSAMLVAREVWRRTGMFDERIGAAHEDLDFCWRARLSGVRVVMTPLARVRHRGSSAAGDAKPEGHHSVRYEEDRAALAAMLKNYSLLSLLWLLPLSLILGLFRLLYLALARRFEEAYDLLSAWGWNVAHLPGTLVRRHRAQKIRRVKDRSLRRFMESAGLRLPRWFATAERILEEQRGVDLGDEAVTRRLRDRTASLVGAHPVITASFLGVIVGAFAFRSLLGTGALFGGVIPAFPRTPSGFFNELLSGYRTTPLGGGLSASPALGVMGGLSSLLFGSTALAQKVLLTGVPVLAAILVYRAVQRLTGRPGPSVLASAAYCASALMLWSFSQGRIDLLIALAVLPAIVERLEVAFGPDEPAGSRWRFVAGTGVTLAVAIAFMPGVASAVLMLILIQTAMASSRRRGLVLTGEAILVAAVLLFPFVPTLIAGGGAAFTSRVGTTNVGDLERLALGPGPGTWRIAAFLPIAALLAFALTGAEHRARALRAMLIVLTGFALSWLSAAGYVPAPLSNPMAYAALAAVGMALLVGYGLTSVMRGLGRESFGLRQIGTVLLSVVLGVGLLLQAASAMFGDWAIGGPERIPAAWAVVDSAAKGDFRVLWIGADTNDPFPAPGGDPQRLAPAGAATLRYALTGQDGITALDTGRPLAGPGADALRRTLNEILSGTTEHGGALLAPFGVRFVVADEGDLPSVAAARLNDQLDLDLVPASGLRIYRNGVSLPPAAVEDVDAATIQRVLSGRAADVAALGAVSAVPMDQVQGGWNGPARSGLVAISTEFSGAWTIEGSEAQPRRSFGWATAFTGTVGPVEVRYGAQLPHTIEIVVLAVLWGAALWITRKPVAR